MRNSIEVRDKETPSVYKDNKSYYAKNKNWIKYLMNF